MKLIIIGTGCHRYQMLKHNLNNALAELGRKADYEEVTDVHKLMGFDVAELPALLVDDNVVVSGRVMTTQQIKDVLVQFDDSENI